MNAKKLIAFALLAAGGYFVYTHFRGSKGKPKLPSDRTPDDALTTTATGAKPAVTQYFPLRKGSTGEKVIELQKAILSVAPTALPKFGADGDFGSETEAAVKSLTGKTSVDSQEDIAKILSIKLTKEAADKLAVQKANRKALAQKLVSLFNEKNGRGFYAVHETAGEVGKITTDGRMLKSGSKVWKKGEIVEFNTGDVSFSINDSGFITAKKRGAYTYFSPYGVEVK